MPGLICLIICPCCCAAPPRASPPRPSPRAPRWPSAGGCWPRGACPIETSAVVDKATITATVIMNNFFCDMDPPRMRGILSLLADNLDHHALLAPPVELAIEDLLPRSKIQFAARDRDDDFAAYHLP